MRQWPIVIALLCIPAYAQLTVTDVTASRALSTVYQNTTGHPILVSAQAFLNQCSFAGCTTKFTVSLVSDSSATPTTVVAVNESTSNAFGGLQTPVFWVVPSGNYYKVTATRTFTVSDPGSPTLARWVESAFVTVNGGTQSVVTGSRSFGSVFQNASSNLMWVAVTGVASGTTTFTATVDSAASPTTVIQQHGCATTLSCTLIFPVLPNYFYKVTQDASGTLSTWTEMTMPPLTGMTQNVVTGSRAVGFGGTYTTYFSGQNAIFASISTTMPGSSANSTLTGFMDSVTPAVNIQTQSSKLQNTLGMIVEAIPSQGGFYAASVDVAGTTLAEWVEWNVPFVFTCTGTCGEKKRRAMN